MNKIKAPREQNGNGKLVIVPDSCTLNYATAAIPEHFFKPIDPKIPPKDRPKRPKYFYDIYLNFLPRDKIGGIHILDIIGGEVFGRLVDGRYYDPGFRIPNHKNNNALKPFSDQLYSRRNSFLTFISTSQGKGLLDVFANALTLQEKIEAYLSSLPDNDKAIAKKEEIDRELKKIRKTLGKNRGEKIIKEYILKHPDPTFFISDDENSRKQVIAASGNNHDGCIYVDNSIGFFGHLQRAGILEKCGFQPWVTPEMIMVEMHKAQPKYLPSRKTMVADYTAIAGVNRKAGPKPVDEWFTGR